MRALYGGFRDVRVLCAEEPIRKIREKRRRQCAAALRKNGHMMRAHFLRSSDTFGSIRSASFFALMER